MQIIKQTHSIIHPWKI